MGGVVSTEAFLKSLSRDLNKVKGEVLQLGGGRACQAEGTASAKALRWDALGGSEERQRPEQPQEDEG